jgi:hypothetical protein
MIVRCPPATITIQPDGEITAVVHDADPGVSYLDSGGRFDVIRSGQPVQWPPPSMAADRDEVELTFERDGLRLVIRHSFVAGWGIRIACTNLGGQPMRIDQAMLGWRPAADHPAWALCAGATGSYAVQPASGRGPILGGVLTQGSFDSVGPDRLALASIELVPGGRYVLQWQWDWYADQRVFDRGRHPGVPRWPAYTVGEVASLTSDEDEALILPAGVRADVGDGQTELSAGAAGSYRVEIRGIRGVTRYDVAWADPLDQVVAGAAAHALGGPVTPAGVVRLEGVHTALACQYALARSAIDDREAVEDALDLFAARFDEETPDPFALAFWVGESERTGDTDLLDRAESALGQSVISPGLGLVATRLALAMVLRGRAVEGVVHRLRQLTAARQLRPGDPAADPLSVRAARLELALVGRPRDATGQEGEAAAGIADQVAGLGAWLGAGLTGRSVRELSIPTQAQLAATLSLTDQSLSTGVRRSWGCSAHELGRRTAVQVLSRLGHGPAGPALSLLSMGEALA